MGSPDDCGKPPGFEAAPDEREAKQRERRADPRHPTNRPATIKLLNPLQTLTDVSVRVLEISRLGLKLCVNQPLMPGTLVQIRFNGKLLLGEVRYCKAVGDDFHAGVRLQDVFDTGL